MMHILHISDTHALHRKLPKLPAADMIIHSGDISFGGKPEEVIDFIEWFCALDYKYKIFIAGNHDFCLDRKSPTRIQKFLPQNCFYLYASGVEIEGVRFWGIPFLISYEVGMNDYLNALEAMPYDTDVVITHRPPLGIMDRSGNHQFGCPDLLLKVLTIKPKAHLFGHIHDAYGTIHSNDTIFSNGSIVDEKYNVVNRPFIFSV